MWKLQENILEKADKDILIDFIRSTDRFTQFTKVKEFEKEWSDWQGCAHSTFVNSGSSADLVMLDAVREFYDFPEGSEVLVPAVTWITNITSVISARLKPVFVDVNLKDLSFDYEQLEKAITPKTKIILITHLLGLPADLEKIQAIADRHKLVILEDCCESHGARFGGKKVGNFGLASTFSYYWGHHMTTVEGGMICTNNEELNDLFILKRSHGLARELHPSKHQKHRDSQPGIDFNFLFLNHGFNVRNTELHAVLGLSQLRHLDRYIKIRNRNHQKFVEITKPLTESLHIIDHPGISSFCLPFIFKKAGYREKLQQVLTKHQVEYRPIVGGNLLRQPYLAVYGDFSRFPNAEIVHNHGLYVGNNQFVNEERLDILKEILKESFNLILYEAADIQI
jgi:CDP-4-dehydro-6-deoxyglucose reductase, E1